MEIWNAILRRKNETLRRVKRVKYDFATSMEERRNKNLNIREADLIERENLLLTREKDLISSRREFNQRKASRFIRFFAISLVAFLLISKIFPYFYNSYISDDRLSSQINSSRQLSSLKAVSTGDYVVSTYEAKIHLGPDRNDRVTNTLYKNQKVKVLEVDGDWARISRYYNGAAEGLNGQVARWIDTKNLSKSI